MPTPASATSRRISQKASRFTESVIREMTREAMKYGAVNLSQGFPDFAAPEDIKRVAMEAIAKDVNQYAITWGAKDFRDAIAKKTKWYLGLEIDPEAEITVTCGSTEGMISTMMATVDPGDEVIVFDPYYENYAPDAILSDATPRYVPLRAPDWSFDREELRAAFNPKTKAIIICNPNNPTGKVFTRAEMEFIAGLCQESDALCFTDEIYEHILYPREGAEIIVVLSGRAIVVSVRGRRRIRKSIPIHTIRKRIGVVKISGVPTGITLHDYRPGCVNAELRLVRCPVRVIRIVHVIHNDVGQIAAAGEKRWPIVRAVVLSSRRRRVLKHVAAAVPIEVILNLRHQRASRTDQQRRDHHCKEHQRQRAASVAGGGADVLRRRQRRGRRGRDV